MSKTSPSLMKTQPLAKSQMFAKSQTLAKANSPSLTKTQPLDKSQMLAKPESQAKSQENPKKPARKSQVTRKSRMVRKSQGGRTSDMVQKSLQLKKFRSNSLNYSPSLNKAPHSSRKSHSLSKSKLSSYKGLSKSGTWKKYGVCTFGRTERFNKMGFHPGLDKSGAMKKDVLMLAPGQYTYDDRPVCMYKKYQKKSAWKRETECEEFSKTMGYRNAEILKNRIFMAKHLGPGSHNIPSEIFKRQDNNMCPNHGFGSQKKFKYHVNLIPPPGTYFYNVTTSYDIRPSIKFLQEERFATKERPWSLAANRYELKGSMRELLDKVVSKRGPYDLFSGDRGNNNTYNKFAVTNGCAPDKIYDLPSDLDYLLYDKQKRRTGKFLKAARFPKKPTVRMMLMDPAMCYRNPKFPGPGHYSLPGGIKIVPESMRSFFGTSKMEVRSGVRWTTLPGPGRYNVKYMKCSASKGGSWVFKSKTKQIEDYKVPVYNAF